MNRQSDEKFHYYILISVIIIATIMRLWQFDFFSYSNDELSAIIRLNYDSFTDLIEYGVKRNDFHPAGVQVFLFYWTKLFGTSEFAVRFPFVIAGIVSVVLAYLIAKKWFGINTGLFSAAAIATLSYPILYSQIARPYSPGLLFCLISICFWSELFINNKWKSKWHLLGYIIFSALAAYTHHFAFLFMIIVGITGLFLITKDNLKNYLLTAFAIFILYLPHLPVFLYQFKIGGVGGEEGWLDKPDSDWFWNYLFYVFNESVFLIIIVSVLFIAPVIINIFKKEINFKKWHIISLVWFLSLFLIGYYYSIYRNPVLQISILIFSFPFLIIFLFSFLNNLHKKIFFSFISLFLLSAIYSTAIEKNYYNQQHFGEFKDITATVHDWNVKYGSENITQAVRTVDKRYLDFYFDKQKNHYEFLQYNLFRRDAFLELKKIVQNSETPYFIFGWTLMGSYIPEDIIQSEFPCIKEEKKYNGLSYIAIYSKDNGNCISETANVTFNTNFNNRESWNFPAELIRDTLGKVAADLSGIEYGPSFSMSANEINNGKIEKVRIYYQCYSADPGDAQMVVTYDSNEQPAYEWISTNLDYFQKGDQWFKVINTFKLPEIKSNDDIIKIYLWNVNKSNILLSDIRIEFFEKEY